MEEQLKPASDKPTEATQGNHSKVMIYVATLILVAAGTGMVVYFWQHGKVNNLSAQQVRLTASNKSLTNEDSNLKAKNTNLSEALQQLQTQVANDSKPSTATSNSVSGANDTKQQPNMEPVLAGKFVINSVRTEPLTDFNGNGGTTFTSGQDALVVNVTITNLTSSTQSYDLFQFYATSNAGAVVDPTVYGNGFSPGIWNNSQLAAGASQTVNILFTPRPDLKILSWTPPTGSTITATLPAPISN